VINLWSEPGKGSIFTVKLPILESTFENSEKRDEILGASMQRIVSLHSDEVLDLDDVEFEEEDQETNDGSSDAAEMKTLMLVEDDMEIRNYLASNFNQHYNVVAFENGQLAWDFLATEVEVDLIISDVMMPVMDGIKFCKLVKSNFNTCHIPLILLTAKTDMDHQLAGLNVGADDYVGKPFVFSILQAKVFNLFKTKQRLIQRYAATLEVEPDKIAFNAMDEEMLKKAVAIVEKNMENGDFTAEEFSREMNMSRSKLHVKLKALTGESAIDFIRRIRFGYACKLLKDGRYSGTDISTMVGYSSPSYFTASFKKYMGCLPSEYLKKH
jgi:YesN/AraC family two-component response regulator